MTDYSEKIRHLIEKLLIHKGRRGVVVRVFPPGGGVRTYSVVLEEARSREQLFLDGSHVEHYGRTGNEQYVLNSIRAAIHNLDRMQKKREAHKDRVG